MQVSILKGNGKFKPYQKKKIVFFCHFFLSYELYLMVRSVLYVILHVMQLQPQI